ncbi:MAG: hypothetical protein Q4E17_05300 [Synergistes sp.]|nr:hypothetical protein [Synergistes sp.]
MTVQLNKKRLVIRLILVALIVILCFALNYFGKEHDVYLDNMEAQIGGKSYEGIAYLTLVIDGNEETEMEFYADDRDVVKLKGPSHTMKVSVINEETEEVIKTVDFSMNLGTEREVMFSLPAIADGAKDAALPVPQSDTQYSDDEDTSGMEATQP